MKFSVKNFFRKRDQVRNILRILAYLLKNSLMENFIFYAVCLTLFEKIKHSNVQKNGGKQTGTVEKTYLFCAKLKVGAR